MNIKTLGVPIWRVRVWTVVTLMGSPFQLPYASVNQEEPVALSSTLDERASGVALIRSGYVLDRCPQGKRLLGEGSEWVR